LTEEVPLEGLREEKYGRVLCYPRYNPEELERRLKELRSLGVRAVEFIGEKKVLDVPVLGKGCVGIVVLAHRAADKVRVALKVRRVDADRVGMQREAEMLRRANAVDVGPKLLDVTENFLVMEFIHGKIFPLWIKELKGRRNKALIRRVLRDLLEQGWRMDGAGLDHGELSRAPKHILINEESRPHILDFETASTTRRCSNVTSLCQYLLLGSQTAEIVEKRLGGKISREGLRKALRDYKQAPTRENLDQILNLCELTDPHTQRMKGVSSGSSGYPTKLSIGPPNQQRPDFSRQTGDAKRDRCGEGLASTAKHTWRSGITSEPCSTCGPKTSST